MFTQVYYHKTRRIYDIYLSRYLKSWYSGQYTDLLRVLAHDDLSVMSDIVRDAEGESENPERHKWARRIARRQHHCVVYETGDHASPAEEKVALKVAKALEEKHATTELITDLDARGTVHKFYVKDDEVLGEEFPIYDKVSGRFARLSEESRIFERVPKRFRVIRVYADVSKESLPELRQFAAEKAKQFTEAI
jgi:HD superfamily phosphohydrolase